MAGYSKRKKITLTGGASGSQTDFQLKLTVVYDGDMQSDFDDLRFTQADGTTLIDAWLETKSDNVSATVWAEFPTTPANTVDADYYMYYGKAVANYWDIGATFVFGDDFDTLNNWTTQNGVPSVSGSEVTLRNAAISHTITFPSSFSVRAKIKYSDNTKDGGRFVLLEDAWNLGTETGPYIGWHSTADIQAYYGAWHDGGDYTSGVYDIIEMRDVDNTAHTFDLMVNDITGISGAGFRNAKTMGMIGLTETDNTADFISDWLLVRKYAANPPTYAFGSEESEAIELSAIIATVTAVSASDLNIIRPLTSTIATATLLSEIELFTAEIRELVATIATATSTSTSDLNILREIESTIGTATTTSTPVMAILREIISTIATTTATTADIKVLRELSATIAVQSALSDIELLLAGLKELTTTIATTTSTSTPDLNVLRELIATIDTQTGSVAILDVLRELIASISTTTSLSDIELLAGVLRELFATIAVATSASVSDLNVVRGMDATIASTTSMSDADLSVLRELASTIASVTLTSTIDLLVETLRELSATISATTSTSTPDLNVLRELTSTIVVTTLLSDIELLTEQLRELVTTIATVTSTSTPEMKVLRELEAIIEATTALSAIELTIPMWLTSNPTITRLKSEGWFE